MKIGVLDIARDEFLCRYCGYLMEKTSTIQKLAYQVRKEHNKDSREVQTKLKILVHYPFNCKQIYGQSWAPLMILCPFNHRSREGKISVISFWLFDFWSNKELQQFYNIQISQECSICSMHVCCSS